jgi:hypothetical protein
MLGRILELHGYMDIVGTNCRDNTGIFKRSSRGLLVNSFHTWQKNYCYKWSLKKRRAWQVSNHDRNDCKDASGSPDHDARSTKRENNWTSERTNSLVPKGLHKSRPHSWTSEETMLSASKSCEQRRRPSVSFSRPCVPLMWGCPALNQEVNSKYWNCMVWQYAYMRCSRFVLI